MKQGNRTKEFMNTQRVAREGNFIEETRGGSRGRPDPLWHGTSYKVVRDGMVGGTGNIS
jgi:hypothetical protein